MNAINLSLIFLLLMTFNCFAQESESSNPPVLTGAAGPIDSENPNLITFRTEDRNYQLNMEAAGFPPALREQLQNNIENPRIESFNIPGNAIVSSERIPFGTRGDCNELPITCDDLTDIVRAGGEDMQLLDFLRAIPGGTLEGFTFITNTRSLQRGEGSHLVDEENPRVIRQSIDGKVTISFVCHPEQDKHNSVEIICFNDETESFETLSYNFSNPVGEGAGRRIEENPQSCISCHGTSDKNGVEGSGAEHIKLNWPEYFFWGDCNPERGITMYGMSDDNMCSGNFRGRLGSGFGPSYSFDGCSQAADRATHEGLIADFARFRQQAQTNECLGTLPWATLPEEGQERVGLELAWTNEDYSNYPYACRAQKQVSNDPTNIPDNPKSSRIGNYSLRTNARMTDTYGHLTARRNARLFRDNPRYDQFKYYLAMEGLRDCLTPEERQDFADRMGITVDPNPSSTALSPQRFPLARAYGEQVVGFGTNDWTMHPPAHLSANPRASTDVYNTVIFSDTNSDHSILDVTLGDILRDVTTGDEALSALADDILPRGVEQSFGSRFSCIDDIGQGVARSFNAREDIQSMCTQLKAIAARELASIEGPTPATEAEISADCVALEDNDSIDLFDFTLTQFEQENMNAGRELSTQCVGCHANIDYELAFIPDTPEDLSSPEMQRLAQYVDDQWFEKVRGHLAGDIQPRMPFGCSGDQCFNELQQNQIIAYLRAALTGAFVVGTETETRPGCEAVNESNVTPPSEDSPTQSETVTAEEL